jgi:Flp pilus assembly protein TadG
MSVVVVLLMFLVMGVAEVGWAFMESSLITHAARDGARFGATLASSERDTSGCIASDNATIHDHVEAALAGTGFEPTASRSIRTLARPTKFRRSRSGSRAP